MALTTPHFSVCCKSHTLRTHLKELVWHTSNHVGLLLPARPTRLSLLLLSRTLHFPPRSLPLSHCFLRPSTPFRSLLRPRASSISPTMSSLTTPPAESNSTPAIETKRVVIKGRVQGVFYRDWTVQNATELGLKGWVRNRRDGYVEAVFSGPSKKVQEMIQRCRRGPPAASVTGLEAFPSDEDPGTGFERKRTA